MTYLMDLFTMYIIIELLNGKPYGNEFLEIILICQKKQLGIICLFTCKHFFFLKSHHLPGFPLCSIMEK